MPEYTGFARRKLVPEGPAEAVPRAAFVELGVTSPFSFLRAASDSIELVLTALELGMDSVGIADRNTLAGVVRMHSAAKGAGLRPLIGCRLDLAPLSQAGGESGPAGTRSAGAAPRPWPRCA
ncbi:MAG: PHP domain-containing protein, partial [Sphingomicrobium sp.]